MPLTRIYLGLGSNIDREKHLCAGLDALAGFLTDMTCSPVFESHPVGIKSGPFFNLVVSALTDLPLIELDRRLKFIEADNGRYAPDRKGLPLDIDVLLYDEHVGNHDVPAAAHVRGTTTKSDANAGPGTQPSPRSTHIDDPLSPKN